jgi:hypothetical protein
LPRDRYGINFNQKIFDNTILSLGYLSDGTNPSGL